jgi:hypothetical protein
MAIYLGPSTWGLFSGSDISGDDPWLEDAVTDDQQQKGS